MTPTDWVPQHRAGDDELLGYTRTDERGTVPLTLFGYPLAEPGSREAAQRVLEAHGLACLAEPWILRREDGPEVEVRIMSAFPESVTVVEAYFGIYGPDSPRHTLPVPTERLSRGSHR